MQELPSSPVTLAAAELTAAEKSYPRALTRGNTAGRLAGEALARCRNQVELCALSWPGDPLAARKAAASAAIERWKVDGHARGNHKARQAERYAASVAARSR